MSPVGGSRHYQGAGLGQIGIWGCPSCGEDNTGPLTQGCVHCGAGVPRAAAPPPPTPPTPDTRVQQGDYADHWAAEHPGATLADAYRAGAQYGFTRRQPQEAQPAEPAAAAAAAPVIDPRTYRTVAAALALFRDQILAMRPEEVESGEWLSAEEATTVIDQLQQLLQEPAHV